MQNNFYAKHRTSNCYFLRALLKFFSRFSLVADVCSCNLSICPKQIAPNTTQKSKASIFLCNTWIFFEEWSQILVRPSIDISASCCVSSRKPSLLDPRRKQSLGQTRKVTNFRTWMYCTSVPEIWLDNFFRYSLTNTNYIPLIAKFANWQSLALIKIHLVKSLIHITFNNKQFYNNSPESRDRFGRWTSPAIENNLSIDTLLAGIVRTSWMSLVVRILSLVAEYRQEIEGN